MQCALCLSVFGYNGIVQNLSAQDADRSVFRFLTLPISARSSALGGPLSSTLSPDIDMISENPAFLTASMSKQWSSSFDNRLGGISRSLLQGAYTFKKWGTFGLGLQYMNYGEIQERNESGLVLGDFRPYDFQLTLLHSYEIDPLVSIGLGVHWLQSRYAQFNASAFALNGGLHYKNPELRNSFGIVFGHVGGMINTLGSRNEALPFEIRAGYSQKLQYLPFEWHLSYRFLNQWKRSLPDENEGEVNFVQMLGRHLVFGGELSIGKALQVRFSYDPWRNQNLAYSDTFDFTGTALGLGIKLKRFDLNISRRIQGELGPEWHIGLISKLR